MTGRDLLTGVSGDFFTCDFGGQGWQLRHLSGSMRASKGRFEMCLRHFRKKINADLRPFKLGNWGTAGWNILPKCSVVRGGPSVVELWNWTSFRMTRRKDVFVDRALVEKKDNARVGDRSEPAVAHEVSNRR